MPERSEHQPLSCCNEIRRLVAWASKKNLAFLIIFGLALCGAIPVAASPYACTKNGIQTYTAAPTGSNCKEVPLPEGWKWLFSDEDFYMLYSPESVVREGDKVQVWLLTHLATPAAFNSKPGNYDDAVANYSFECGRREQTLIRSIYSLKGKLVRERLPDQSVEEAVQPGTASDILLKFFCTTGGGLGVKLNR